VFANALARQRYERRLLEGEARLAAGAELAGLGFYEADFDGGVVYTDERLRELLGVPADRQQGVQVIQSGRSRSILTTATTYWTCASSCTTGGWKASTRNIASFIRPRAIGGCTTWPASPGATPRTHPEVLRCPARHHADKRAEEALRELSGRLILAHEDERALLARELHDDVTQRLAMLAIEVGRAEFAATEGKQAEVMRSVGEQLVRLSEDIHALAYQLHPSVLEDSGCRGAARRGRTAPSPGPARRVDGPRILLGGG